MNTDDLIKNLADNLKPVKKQSSPNVFAFKYLIVLFLVIVLSVFFLRIRNDLNLEVGNINFLVDTFLNLLVLLSGIFLTGRFSTAGRNYSNNYKLVMLFLFIGILGLNAYRLSFSSLSFNSFSVSLFDKRCFVVVMALSLLSTLIMTIAVAKRIVFNAGLVGGIIGMLSFSVGSLVITMHCPITSNEHVGIYHALLPLLTGSLIGYACGKVFLKV